MSIQVTNDIHDEGKAREVVFCLHLPVHLKHSNHLTQGQSDSFEWGLGGKCDDKKHEVSCKVNLPGDDAHPKIEAKNGDKITVKYSDNKYILTKT